jgi:hypothetical protein
MRWWRRQRPSALVAVTSFFPAAMMVPFSFSVIIIVVVKTRVVVVIGIGVTVIIIVVWVRAAVVRGVRKRRSHHVEIGIGNVGLGPTSTFTTLARKGSRKLDRLRLWTTSDVFRCRSWGRTSIGPDTAANFLTMSAHCLNFCFCPLSHVQRRKMKCKFIDPLTIKSTATNA